MHWNDGRRVVELGVLAKGLQACIDCKQPLQLTDVVNEKRYGPASILNVLCCCGQINTISIAKCHRSAGSRRGVSIYDINTKLATGIYITILFHLILLASTIYYQFSTVWNNIVLNSRGRLVLTCELNVRVWIQFIRMLHAGIDETCTHINNLLAAVNVPVIYHKTLKRREREAGQGIEKLSERSFSEALNEELERPRKR